MFCLFLRGGGLLSKERSSVRSRWKNKMSWEKKQINVAFALKRLAHKHLVKLTNPN